ncbi:MAG: redoxin family protein, partial [Dongiaceae bacterium]
MFEFRIGGVRRRLLYILPPLGFLALAVLFWVGLGHDPSVVPSALIDQPVPEFDLPPLKDDKPGFASANLTGEVSLVNVFASWCVPCRVEHPILMRLAKREDIAIIGLNYKDKPEDAKAWHAQLGGKIPATAGPTRTERAAQNHHKLPERHDRRYAAP